MMSIRRLVRVRRHTDLFRYITVNKQEFLKRIFRLCIELNVTKLIRHTQMYKNTFAIKNSINSISFLCTESHKSLWIQYVLWLEKVGRVFSVELRLFFPLFLLCIAF